MRYELIYINNLMYAVKDKPKEGQFYIDPFLKSVIWMKPTGLKGLYDSTPVPLEIVATNNYKSGRPFLPVVKEDIEALALNHWNMQYLMAKSDDTKPYVIEDFKAGYKAASPKQFTEEDIVNFLEWLKPKLGYNQETGKFHVDVKGTGEISNEKITSKSIVDTYVQSLKPKPVAVEIELWDAYEDVLEGGEFVPRKAGKYLPLENNYVKVKQWYYE